MSDIDIVAACLKHWRQFAFKSRYGGLMDKLKETEAALEALERIAQPSFLDGFPKSEAPTKESECSPTT